VTVSSPVQGGSVCSRHYTLSQTLPYGQSLFLFWSTILAFLGKRKNRKGTSNTGTSVQFILGVRWLAHRLNKRPVFTTVGTQDCTSHLVYINRTNNIPCSANFSATLYAVLHASNNAVVHLHVGDVLGSIGLYHF
jgi:hypothetical protein